MGGNTVVSSGGQNVTVTGTLTANSWDASQDGNEVSAFGAVGVSEPITADYAFSAPVEDLTFTLVTVS